MIELRDYQKDALREMSLHNEGVCVAPAGSGKTIIAAALVLDRIELLNCMMPGMRHTASWIAHTKEQVEQACNALQALGVPDKADCVVSCYAGHNDLLTRCDILIVDECHWAGCDQVKRLIENAGIANECSPYIYGFTATPKREDGFDITEVIGPIRYEVSRADIQAVGGVLPAEVRVVGFGYANELEDAVQAKAESYYNGRLKWCDAQTGTDEQWKRCQYRAALDIGIRKNENRDCVIAGIVASHGVDGESVIVLVDSKEHGKRLESLICGSVMVYSGKAGRSRILDDFKAGKIGCIICTSLMDEGLDIPIAGVLVMAGSGKAFGKIVQRTGRVLRPHTGKQCGVIYDIMDKGHGMLVSQHWKRRAIYRKIGYRISS